MIKCYAFISILIVLSSCHYRYQDNFPPPCTPRWNDEIEQEVQLVDLVTKLPRTGSSAWQLALDEQLQISIKTGYTVGELEWCHAVHQALIGL